MKKSIQTLTAVVFLTFALVSMGTAQMMMGGSRGNMPMNTSDSTSASSKTELDIMPMMKNVSNHYDVTVSDFDKLQQHFNKMMQITDMKALKVEMKKHQEMMTSMHKDMVMQEDMFKNMMSSMHSYSDMHGMMTEPDEK